MNVGACAIGRRGDGGAFGIDLGDDAPAGDREYRGDMSVRGLADRWGDGLVAFALAVAAEYELWFSPPSGLSVTGGRAVLAVLFGLMTVPLAWRRRAPAEVLVAVTSALAVATFLLHHPLGVPAGVFWL
jgi:hypothetical protein